MILKELPHVTYLNINSVSISQIEDENNEDTNAENRFDNIDQLEINAKIPWEGVSCLMKYFPKLLNLHVYCECSDQVFDAIRGSFPLNDLTGVEYLRRVNPIKEEQEKNFIEWQNLFKSWNEQ
jgi:hypothetical protein